MKELDLIETFVEVVQQGSFSEAASKLGVSTSHVSRQITALEKRLGVNLLFRTTRSVKLREEASGYHAECATAIERIRAAEQLLNRSSGKLAGAIRITCATSFGQQYLAPQVNAFMALHPDIEIELYLTNRNVNLIEEGFDLGVRMGKLEDSSLLSRRLCDRTEYICGSRRYFQRIPPPQCLEDLEQHICLRGTNDFWNVYVNGQRERLPVFGRFRSNSGYALLDAATRGIGLVQLPDYYVDEHLKHGELVAVLDVFRDPYSGVWLVYPNTKFRPARLSKLIEFLTDKFQGFKVNKAKK